MTSLISLISPSSESEAEEDTIKKERFLEPLKCNGNSNNSRTNISPTASLGSEQEDRKRKSEPVVVVQKINCQEVGGTSSSESEMGHEVRKKDRKKDKHEDEVNSTKRARRASNTSSSENSRRTDSPSSADKRRRVRTGSRRLTPVYKDMKSSSESECGTPKSCTPKIRRPLGRPSQKPTHKESKTLSDSDSEYAGTSSVSVSARRSRRSETIADQTSEIKTPIKSEPEPSHSNVLRSKMSEKVKPVYKECDNSSDPEHAETSPQVKNETKPTARPSRKPIHKESNMLSTSTPRSRRSETMAGQTSELKTPIKSEPEPSNSNCLRIKTSEKRKPVYKDCDTSSDPEQTDISPKIKQETKPTARPSRKPIHKESKAVFESEPECVQTNSTASPRSRRLGTKADQPPEIKTPIKSEPEPSHSNCLRSKTSEKRKPVYKDCDNFSDPEQTETPEIKQETKPTTRPSRKPIYKENKASSDSQGSDFEPRHATRQRQVPTARSSNKPMHKETKVLSSDLESSDQERVIRVADNKKPIARPHRKLVHQEVPESESSDSEIIQPTGLASRRLNGEKPQYKEANSESNHSEDMDSDDNQDNDWVSSSTRKKGRQTSTTPTRDKTSSDEENESENNSSSSFDSSGSDYSTSRKKKDKKIKNQRKSKKVLYKAPTKPSGPKVGAILDRRMGKVGATGPATTKYNIDKSGDDPNITLPSDTEIEPQYLVKWAGESHLHNTWESFKTLELLNDKFSLIRVQKYEAAEDEFETWSKRADPDDVEYAKCEREMQKELMSCYSRAERIIARDTGSNGKLEFFVKWESLPYEEATWESGDLIKKYFRPVVDKFDKLRRASTIPENSKFDNARQRPKFVREKVQPEYMKGDTKDLILRDYQLDSINWLINSWCKRNSVILGDEMGLGKTIQAICFLQYLMKTHGVYGPFLIVVPLSTISAWMKEFGLWAPDMNVVTLIGGQASREIIKKYEFYGDWRRHFKFNVLLTSYEMVVKEYRELSQKTWQVMIVDEAHRLKNRKSEWHKCLANYKANHKILMTGTPIQNSLEELWSLLHFIMPGKFPTWESFEEEHSGAANDGYKKLHTQLEPFLIRRVKKDVEKSLPLKREQILRVPMTPDQREIYKHIISKNYTALKRENNGNRHTFMNMAMQLRKCCNHINLIKYGGRTGNHASRPEESIEQLLHGSAKLMLLDKLLVRLKSMGHRVLIFSQFVMMLDVIEELLEMRRFVYQRLDGTMGNDLRQQALNRFNEPDSKDFCFLLSTRAGGLGLNLTAANTVIIFDSDWNPQNDLQAQARAHRIGQTRQVNVYKIITKNSVEETIIERAKQKMVLDHLVIQRMDTTGRMAVNPTKRTTDVAENNFTKEELNAILKFGAEELFKDDTKSSEYVCDIDEILRQADEEEPQPENEKPGEELLSAFKVISFANDGKDWDEIIPEDIRAKVEAEEKDRALTEVLMLDRRSRHARKQLERNSPKKKKLKTDGKRRNTNAGQAHDSDSSLSSETGPHPGPSGWNVPDDDFALSSASDSDDTDSDFNGGGGTSFLPKNKMTVSDKRQEPKPETKPKLFGLTQNQVKDFVRCFTKFPKPMSRLLDIAQAAGLKETSVEPLQKLGKLLLTAVSATMTAAEKYNAQRTREVMEQKALLKRLQVLHATQSALREDTLAISENIKTTAGKVLNQTSQPEVVTLDDDEDVNVENAAQTAGPSRVAPQTNNTISDLPGLPSPPVQSLQGSTAFALKPLPPPINPYNFKFDVFPNYKINARLLTREMDLLEPLGYIVPTNGKERKLWTFDCPVIAPKFDVPWGKKDDTQLLVGIWEHGHFGFFFLKDKIPVLQQKLQLPATLQKPTPMDIQRRFTYLMQVINRYKAISLKQNISIQAAIAASLTPAPIIPKPAPIPAFINPFTVVLPPNDLTKLFNCWEMKRFVTALEEFPNPFSRMQEVANHSMITKPLHVLARLGQHILEKCREQEAKNQQPNAIPLTAEIVQAKPTMICIQGCTIQFSALLSRVEQLMALDDLIPASEEGRRFWSFPYDLKSPPGYTVFWGKYEDTRLLLGVWEHGISNIEAVCKNDPCLQAKIFDVASNRQPNFRTISTRVRNLLNVIYDHRAKRSPSPQKTLIQTQPIVRHIQGPLAQRKVLFSPQNVPGSSMRIVGPSPKRTKVVPQTITSVMALPTKKVKKNVNGLMKGFVNPSSVNGIKRRTSVAKYLQLNPKLTRVQLLLHRLDPKSLTLRKAVPKPKPTPIFIDLTDDL